MSLRLKQVQKPFSDQSVLRGPALSGPRAWVLADPSSVVGVGTALGLPSGRGVGVRGRARAAWAAAPVPTRGFGVALRVFSADLCVLRAHMTSSFSPLLLQVLIPTAQEKSISR